MFSVTQELRFCYGHRLLEHPGRCGRLHGHNGVARVTLRAVDLDARGMVTDFDDVEKALRAFLDQTIDHRLLLHRDDPVAELLRKAGESFVALEVHPTAENIARLIFDQALRAGLPVALVEVVEQQGSVASYAP